MHRQGETELREATRLAPDDAMYWRELAWVLYLQRSWSDCQVASRRALELAPPDELVPILLGAALMELQRPHEVIPVLIGRADAGHVGQDYRAWAWRLLAEAYGHTGDWQRAADAWRESERLAPDGLGRDGRALYAEAVEQALALR